MSLLDEYPPDPTALAVRELRECMGRYATACNPGTQHVDVLIKGARKYRDKAKPSWWYSRWTPEVCELALADGAHLGDGWIARDVPGCPMVMCIERLGKPV